MKKVRVRTLVMACLVALMVGATAMYFGMARPFQVETKVYRAAWFWANYLRPNSFFGAPVGATWEGQEFVMVFSNGYRIAVGAKETKSFRPDGTRSVHSFQIDPPADVRRLKLENLL